MRAELLAVGDELLRGSQVDGNSAWLAARLGEIGVAVTRIVVVGDDVTAIVGALREGCGRADVVLVGGGLGPTADDVTRDAVAVLAGAPLRRRPELVAAMTARFAVVGRPMPAANLVQADLPEAATALTPFGTAAGFVLEVGGHGLVVCLPGVPAELRAAVDAEVLPLLARRAGAATTVTRVVRTGGMAESAVGERLAGLTDVAAAAGSHRIGFLAAGGATHVVVTATGVDRTAALAVVDPVVADAVALLGDAVSGLDDEGPAWQVGRALQRRGWTLAVAESVTGGGVGARLVEVPGASAWFLGGLVVYATPQKTRLAGVEPGLLDAHGPVSEAVALALAQGARRRTGADVGLAVVGTAGPTTQGDVDVGTIWVALQDPLGPLTRRVAAPGLERVEVQLRAAGAALDLLRRRLAAA